MTSTPDSADGGPALFRLVRFWSRRWINRASEDLTQRSDHVQHILVVEAVRTAVDGPEEATVGTVAHQLGLDHSGASRMVRDAVTAGYLVRSESEHDRRRVQLRLTAAGEELLDGSHRWQSRVFHDLTAGWDPHDRDQFAAYLRRLATEVGA
ncbi:MarR family winged helix-turn-helix transcriptional regulator [Kutzneria sp. NPDC052558]|uniref:MarR family winged helix-turn-helix transcriptional regulator n=1 Tax=Kutzneria sp. NPDC052558 TaxID=3364121 RepID=UPI0037C914C8